MNTTILFLVFKSELLASFKVIYRILIIAGLLIPAGCSVEKNTGLSRFYHALTARYNIYFNGYESFRDGLDKISGSYTDDYGELLRTFEYSDPSTAQIASADMERAIQKASKLVTLKSITAEPKDGKDLNPDQKEFNKWVDDSYLLIAKARFYKHEFDEAARVFNYNITESNDPGIRTESLIWLARISIETGNLGESQRLLAELDPATLSTKSLSAMYFTSLADQQIKQKRYPQAAESLEKCLEDLSGKRTKYRLTYLLAQLYDLSGEQAKATEFFREVIRMNPPYNVEFMARINIAGGFDVSTGNPREMRQELEKMLKDSKNRDFHDQIFYALGEIAMKEGKENEALDFYRQSVSASSGNQNQKGRSYLAMADFFYARPDFILADRYYDSSVFFIAQNHPQYKLIKAKADNLNSLVTELEVIQQEDSLQRVAMMSESERAALISSIISDINKAESEGKKSEYDTRFNLGQYYENERRFEDNIKQEGKWYFYNQAALTFGRTEFRRRWGERRLEDNWRRSNKTIASSSLMTESVEDIKKTGIDTSRAVTDYKKPEFYLKDLPLTPELMEASKEKLARALLNAGKAYSENIGDNEKATETLETLIERFPEHELVPEALFTMYNLNKESNSIKAEPNRQRLLGKYPESEYARILSDPDYYTKKMAGLKLVEELYQKAYNAYSAERFEEALSFTDQGIEKYRQDPLIPKFLLLRAHIVGRTGEERQLREELNNIIKNYPATAESKKAIELLAWLDQKTPELKQEEEIVKAKELYVADTASAHLFVLVINDRSFNINQATFDVINYNIDNHTNKNYRAEGSLVDNRYILITVSGFAGFSQAMSYYNSFITERIVRNPSGTGMVKFLISNTNLQVLNKDLDPDRYLLFFKENYLQVIK